MGCLLKVNPRHHEGKGKTRVKLYIEEEKGWIVRKKMREVKGKRCLAELPWLGQARCPDYEEQGTKWCVTSREGPRGFKNPELDSTIRIPIFPDTGRPRTTRHDVDCDPTTLGAVVAQLANTHSGDPSGDYMYFYVGKWYVTHSMSRGTPSADPAGIILTTPNFPVSPPF